MKEAAKNQFKEVFTLHLLPIFSTLSLSFPLGPFTPPDYTSPPSKVLSPCGTFIIIIFVPSFFPTFRMKEKTSSLVNGNNMSICQATCSLKFISFSFLIKASQDPPTATVSLRRKSEYEETGGQHQHHLSDQHLLLSFTELSSACISIYSLTTLLFIFSWVRHLLPLFEI
jgi:hypothetical protein